MEKIKITGRVVAGNRIGRTLGFPTANIAVENRPEIKDGVYAADAVVDGAVYHGMANVGYKPTISGISPGVAVSSGPAAVEMRLLEINLFGFDGDIYGETIEVELLEFIREERAFSSLGELREMVDKDREAIEKYFKIR